MIDGDVLIYAHRNACLPCDLVVYIELVFNDRCSLRLSVRNQSVLFDAKCCFKN